MSLQQKRVLIIISGGIAAYKGLELIRLLRRQGADVRCILTEGGRKFITPLSVAALSENEVYTDLWSLKNETEMGHIRLSREADFIVIAPASANLLAKMAGGQGDDLASTTLLAADKPVFAAPAMNCEMWANPAVQRNIKTLKQDEIRFIGPDSGETACGETGFGRMSEPEDILATLLQASYNGFSGKTLKGKKALVTSGPTYEPIDPVRFIGNRSSGKQGHAIAKALKQAGADVTLVTGPVALADPSGIRVVHVETANDMYAACEASLPADIAICAAAVADWGVKESADKMTRKIKKDESKNPLQDISFTLNPDILNELSNRKDNRPSLVIGFAAETEDLENNARKKLEAKGCDMILANDVGGGNAFGSDKNAFIVLQKDKGGDIHKYRWPVDTKDALAQKLVRYIHERYYNDRQTKESYSHAAE